MQDIIEVDQLSKTFGEIKAVDGVSFSVGAREIFGFLGPNGAGKSTTIKMLATLLKPTGGRATLAGYDVATQPTEVRQSIGLVFQDQSLDNRLTADENLKFHAMLYDVPSDVYRERADQVLKMVDLTDRRGSHRHDVLRRHEAAARDRPRSAPPPEGALPRRADARARRPDAQRDLAARARAARRGRHDRVHDDALHGRGGELRPDRDHRSRQDPGDRHARRAQAIDRRRHDHRVGR